MAELTVQVSTDKGITPTFAAATAGGDVFQNDGKQYLHIKNGAGASMSVTIEAQRKCSFGELHDEVISVPASGEKIIGPFNTTQFNDTNYKVNVTYSAVTTVTVAVISL